MRIFTLILLMSAFVTARAETITTVGGTTSTGSAGLVCQTNAFSQTSNVNSSSLTDYAQFSILAAAGCNYYLHSTLHSIGAAGTEAGFRIQLANLTSVISGITIDTYLNGEWQESASGSELLSLFDGEEGNIFLNTTKAYDALRISFNGLSTAAYNLRIFWGYGNNTTVETLPISFQQLRIMEVSGLIRLDWEMEDIGNLESIEIEKSFNNNKYTTIGTISGQSTTSYTYFNGIDLKAWYRLRANCKNGQVHYSQIVLYTPHIKSAITLYPNPVSGNTLSLQLNSVSEEFINYLIVDGIGKEMKKGIFAKEIQIDITSFKKGMYFFITNRGESIRFLRQ